MKKLAILLSFVLVLTSAFSMGSPNVSTENNIPDNLFSPTYQKIDNEIVQMARENGLSLDAVKTKEFRGNAYLKPQNSGGVLNNLDMTGKENKGIAILVDFPTTEGKISEVPGVDYPAVPAKYFDDLLNGTEYNPYELDVFKNLATYNEYTAPTNRTMRNYYTEVSYGQFQIDVEVVDWVTLPKPYEYYLGQNNGYKNDNGDAHMGELVYDAIQAADDKVDFSQYARAVEDDEVWTYEDGTPYVDEFGNTVTQIVPNVFIIHRGTGAEFSGDPSVIWSHKWDIMSAKYFGYYDVNGTYMDEKNLKYTTVDGVAVNTYNICPEVGRDITGYLKVAYPDRFPPEYTGVDPSPAYPGVYAHEFGHVLGLPDQYDYGYESEGTGMYTLMAGGSYGRNIPSGYYSGNTPVHMDAWSKLYLGFADAQLITPANGNRQKITLRPSSQYPDIFRVDVPGSSGREYFLLENRQQIGFDEGLQYMVNGKDTHGLAVYQISNDILARNFSRPNEAANWFNNHTGAPKFKDASTGETHYGISLIQADGYYELEKGLNDGDSGDLFPGKYNVTSIGSKLNLPINTSSILKWTGKNLETGISIENIVENADGTITCEIVFKK